MDIIKTYIDKCLNLSELHKEYLGYLPFYEGEVVNEMQEELNINDFSESPDSVFIKQGEEEVIIFKCSDKDSFWSAIENNVTNEEIEHFEKRLGITLPKSYKKYLKYKHHYEIFWDINIILFAKPVKDWDKILIEQNEEMRDFVLEKGYLAIGKYSDYGIIGLKMGSNENEELEVSLIDCEDFSLMANNFTELLKKTMELEEPKIENLKDWHKKMKIFNRK